MGWGCKGQAAEGKVHLKGSWYTSRLGEEAAILIWGRGVSKDRSMQPRSCPGLLNIAWLAQWAYHRGT